MPFFIILGALLGVIIGLLFGDLSGFTNYVGEAYIQLLLMCVYPYVVASLLNGLGRMDSKVASRVFRKSWFFYVLAWIIAIGTMMILGTIFPEPGSPKVIFPSKDGQTIDIVKYFIPGNFLQSVSKNYVPAVVFFAVIFGIAMQRIPKKDTFIEITENIKKSCVIVWNWVVYIAPLGVMALFAETAATIDPHNLEGLLVYILVFFIISIVLTFVILPMIMSSLAPVSYRELLRGVQNGLLLAIVTNLAVVALPVINDFVVKKTKEQGIDETHVKDIVGTQISVAYPLVQLGNFFVAFFIMYASYFYNSPLSISQYFMLPFLTLFSTFGSPSTAVESVNFISTVFNCQGGFNELFVASSSLTRFAQVALSVMGFTFVTLLATLSYYGKLRYHKKRLTQTIIVFITFILLVYAGAKSISSVFERETEIDFHSLKISEDLSEGLNVKVYHDGDIIKIL
jgi:proton glutamate symport protein